MIKMKMRINFDCDSLINLKTLVIFLSLVFSFNAHAGLEICNESQKYPISVAVAFQKILMVGNGNYEVSGWHEVSPKDCTILLEGDLNGDGYFGYKIWIHAVSKGIVLTNRQFGMDYSDQQFCISNDKFSLTGNGAGVAHTCSKNKYLAPFAIYLDDKDDESLYYLNPDEIIINNPNKSPSSRARLPDLHGALAISSTGRHSTVSGISKSAFNLLYSFSLAFTNESFVLLS